MDKIKIGLYLKKLRLERGLTQKELSEYIDVEEITIRRWEHGYSFIAEQNLGKISSFFGVSIIDILNGGETYKSARTQSSIPRISEHPHQNDTLSGEQHVLDLNMNKSKEIENSDTLAGSLEENQSQIATLQKKIEQKAREDATLEDINQNESANQSDEMSHFKKRINCFFRSLVASFVIVAWGFICAETDICDGILGDRLANYPPVCLFAVSFSIWVARDFCFSENDDKAKKSANAGSIIFVIMGILWLIGFSFFRTSFRIK